MTITLCSSALLQAKRENLAIKQRRKFLKHHAKKQGLQCRMEKDERERKFDYKD